MTKVIKEGAKKRPNSIPLKPYAVTKLKLEAFISSAPTVCVEDDLVGWKHFASRLIVERSNKAALLVRNKFKNLEKFLLLNYPTGETLAECIFMFVHNIPIRPVCKECNERISFLGVTEKFCSFCSSECSSKNLFIKEKIKNTCLDRYGGTSPFSSRCILEKMEASNLEKFGHINPFGNKEISEKVKQTFLRNYGTTNPGQSPVVKEKMRLTSLEKYGVDHPRKSEVVKAAISKTNMEKYGVPFAMQNKTIQEKSQKNARRLKYFILPSGKSVSYQGYEDVLIKFFLDTIGETSFYTGHDGVPSIKYSLNGKTKVYFPDFFLKDSNTIAEVKSLWTLGYKGALEEMEAKRLACEAFGYKFILYICDKKQILQTLYGEVNEQTIRG